MAIHSLYKLQNESKRKSLFFFGLKLPFGKKTPETFFTEHKSFLETDEMQLPLGIITEYGAEFSSDEFEKSESLQKKLALYDNALYVRALLDYSEIKSSYIIEKGNEYEFCAECEQEIGVLQEIYVEN